MRWHTYPGLPKTLLKHETGERRVGMLSDPRYLREQPWFGGSISAARGQTALSRVGGACASDGPLLRSTANSSMNPPLHTPSPRPHVCRAVVPCIPQAAPSCSSSSASHQALPITSRQSTASLQIKAHRGLSTKHHLPFCCPCARYSPLSLYSPPDPSVRSRPNHGSKWQPVPSGQFPAWPFCNLAATPAFEAR